MDNEFYVQDDVRVTSRLTPNAGVRYYLISGSNGGQADNDRISALVPWLYDPAKAPGRLSSGELVAGTGHALNGFIPSIANSSMSLFKTIQPAERMRFKIGIETFNTFHHPQFEAVGSTLATATYGMVTDARDPRLMQLRAKTSF